MRPSTRSMDRGRPPAGSFTASEAVGPDQVAASSPGRQTRANSRTRTSTHTPLER